MGELETTEGHIQFDGRFDAYKGFFDHAWAKRIFPIVDGTKLEPPFFELCTDWKSAANTFRLPWLTITCVESYHKGVFEEYQPNFVMMVDAFRQYILGSQDFELSRAKRRQLLSPIW